MRSFQYYAPTSLQEALDTLHEQGDSGRPLGGGTDIVVQMKEGGLKFSYPSYLVSLKRVPELKGIDYSQADGLRIGAGVTMMEVATTPVVQQRYSIVSDGANIVGSLQTMNVATVGGNICNAAPSADIVPSLLACEAQVRIAGASGEKMVPLAQFFLGPGKTVLQPGELLVEVLLPPQPPRSAGAYQRHTPRKQMDIAVVGVGVQVSLDEAGERFIKARIALGAVAPTPIRATQAEAALEGQSVSEKTIAAAAEAARNDATPITDVRASAQFRKHLVGVMTERLLNVAVQRAKTLS